jgi:hypothetical protein
MLCACLFATIKQSKSVTVHADQATSSDDSSNRASVHQARQAQSKLTMDPDKALLDFAQPASCCKSHCHHCKHVTCIKHLQCCQDMLNSAGVLVGMRYFHSPAAAGAMLMNDFQDVRRNLRGGFTESDADQHDVDAAWDDSAGSHTQSHRSNADRWSIQAARRHSTAIICCRYVLPILQA